MNSSFTETDSCSVIDNTQTQNTINDILLKYDQLSKNKLEIDEQISSLSKQYLKELIHQCKYNEAICENCWSIVKIVKGVNDHTIITGGVKKILCKKNTIVNRMQEESLKSFCQTK